MVFKIIVIHQALTDTFEGIEWYEKQSKGLGKRFYQAIQNGYKTIRKNPYFQIRHKSVRCFPLEKFPYMIHFKVVDEQNEILVIGIFSSHRDPKTWEQRTNENN